MSPLAARTRRAVMHRPVEALNERQHLRAKGLVKKTLKEILLTRRRLVAETTLELKTKTMYLLPVAVSAKPIHLVAWQLFHS